MGGTEEVRRSGRDRRGEEWEGQKSGGVGGTEEVRRSGRDI